MHRVGEAGPIARPAARVGVIDLGSNTFHLTVASVGQDRTLTVLADAKETVRLVRAVERKVIGEEGLANGRAALGRLVVRAREVGGDVLLGVATSALREAEDGRAFIERARAEHGFPIEVLDGDEEGRLVWSAARSEVPEERGRIVVLDVGGGSIEVAAGAGETCTFARSFPLGVLRLRHRHLSADGVLRVEHVRSVREHVAREIAPAAPAVRADGSGTLLLTAGTARAIGRICEAMGWRGPGAPVTADALRAVAALSSRVGPGGLAKLGVAAGRLDTLGPGAVAIESCMAVLGFTEARVCERGLREGVALREAERLFGTRTAGGA